MPSVFFVCKKYVIGCYRQQLTFKKTLKLKTNWGRPELHPVHTSKIKLKHSCIYMGALHVYKAYTAASSHLGDFNQWSQLFLSLFFIGNLFSLFHRQPSFFAWLLFFLCLENLWFVYPLLSLADNSANSWDAMESTLSHQHWTMHINTSSWKHGCNEHWYLAKSLNVFSPWFIIYPFIPATATISC